MAKVLVLAEQKGGKLRNATLNAITFAQQIVSADGGSFSADVLGGSVGGVASALTGFGAEKVYTVEHAHLENYLAEPYSFAASAIAQQFGFDFVVVTSTTFGKDVLPRVAVRLGAGQSSDTRAYLGGGKFIRAMWADNAIATVEVTTAVKVASALQTQFPAATATGGSSPIEAVALDVPAPKTKFIKMEGVVSARPELTEARVVVSGGRGIKDPSNNHLIEGLADTLGAAVGWTRAVVDAGWAPNDLQVGQTGKIVAPELYVAVGISGAIQHLAGMKNSKTIVAINKDPEAPIFTVADFGLVADLFDVVPEFKTKLAAAKG